MCSECEIYFCRKCEVLHYNQCFIEHSILGHTKEELGNRGLGIIQPMLSAGGLGQEPGGWDLAVVDHCLA